VISWFKDIPDMKGDSLYRIKSLVLVYSPRSTFILGNSLVACLYLLTILLKYLDCRSGVLPVSCYILFYGHILLLLLFVVNALSIKLADQTAVRKFYKRFWYFFFAEYLLYLLAYVV
jgi:4-hydroxybenzoate polyprenyltransferase